MNLPQDKMQKELDAANNVRSLMHELYPDMDFMLAVFDPNDGYIFCGTACPVCVAIAVTNWVIDTNQKHLDDGMRES